jgi:hypothetical protein
MMENQNVPQFPDTGGGAVQNISTACVLITVNNYYWTFANKWGAGRVFGQLTPFPELPAFLDEPNIRLKK